MISIYKYTVFCLLALCAMVACKKAEIEGPGFVNPDALTPVDLVLNMYYPQPESVDDKSRSQRRTITLGDVSDAISPNIATSRQSNTKSVNTTIRDLNIFMFYNDSNRPDRDTVVRHYYLTAERDDLHQILLKNLYIGTYEMFVIANNHYSFCDDHADHYGCQLTPDQVRALWSSTKTSASDKNLMSYYNSSVMVDRFGNGTDAAQNIFEIKLELLGTKIDLFVENKLPFDISRQDYISLVSYSLTNASNSTPLFESSTYELCPPYEDLTYARPVNTPTGTTNITSNFYILPNYRGDGSYPLAVSHKDRTNTYAPEGATAMMLNLDYHVGYQTSVLSYIIFLGKTGAEYGYNNYDVRKGICYDYDISVGKPDLDDPRVMSISVTNETEIFKYFDYKDQLQPIESNLRNGTVIGRPLSVEFSNAFDNKLLLSVEGVVSGSAPGATFEVWNLEQTIKYYPTEDTPDSEHYKISEFLIPDALITKDTPESSKSKSSFFIKYYHNSGLATQVEVNAMITVQTTSGLRRTIIPAPPTSKEQTIIFENK